MSSGAGQGVKPGKRNDVYNSEFRALPFSIRRNNFNSYLMDNYWHSVEEDWRNSNLATLTPLLNITCKVHQFVADVATSSEITQAKPSARLTVERLLLRRLGEELRAVEILAERGHGLRQSVLQPIFLNNLNFLIISVLTKSAPQISYSGHTMASWSKL